MLNSRTYQKPAISKAIIHTMKLDNIRHELLFHKVVNDTDNYYEMIVQSYYGRSKKYRIRYHQLLKKYLFELGGFEPEIVENQIHICNYMEFLDNLETENDRLTQAIYLISFDFWFCGIIYDSTAFYETIDNINTRIQLRPFKSVNEDIVNEYFELTIYPENKESVSCMFNRFTKEIIGENISEGILNLDRNKLSDIAIYESRRFFDIEQKKRVA